ncbi:type VI secretion system protein TssA [Serratia sp. 2723]|uniref:type VI secretion system protein TssA n=1 Tax=unclassified Serratia (in: enterobacteria) TaxID=2647522 RepID=UPI003D1CF676
MDIDTLLSPISSDAPCGDNLEYDADFLAMDKASIGKAEQQFGSTIIPAEAPDWTQVERLATTLLTRTKDLRVMFKLTHAWTQIRGLAGYADGLMLIHQALVRYWDTLLPPLDFDGEIDPLFRINVLAGLGDTTQLTSCIRTTTLLKSASGEISLRDAGALLDGSKQDCPGFPGGRSRLQAELAQGSQPVSEVIIALYQTLNDLRAEVSRHLGESALPEMEGLLHLFRTLTQACQPVAGTPPTAEEPVDVSVTAITPAPANAPAFSWHHAQIQSRDDAKLMLDKVKHYFSQHEPSHPAPLMIERVQRLITLDFMQIVRDLAPDGVSQVETILGMPEIEENG